MRQPARAYAYDHVLGSAIPTSFCFIGSLLGLRLRLCCRRCFKSKEMTDAFGVKVIRIHEIGIIPNAQALGQPARAIRAWQVGAVYYGVSHDAFT